MTDTLLVTSTAAGSGKTAVAIALAELAADRGLRVGYMKPKGTRLRSREGRLRDEDPGLAREVLDLADDLEDMSPITYSETFLREALRGRERPPALRETLRTAHETIATDRDVVILEGARSVATGGVVDLADPAMLDLLDARAVVIDRYEGPERLDDLLWSLEPLRDRLEGVVFNHVDADRRDDLEAEVVPYLESRGIGTLGILPRERELAGIRIADLADDLGASVLTDAPTDAYVERFVVGAMGAEAALRHFRRTSDAVVITGGDRPEIHAAALEAPGVRCLLLTGGYRPKDHVIATAERRDVPILTVSMDTLGALEQAESILSEGRTRDAATVGRMRELLSAHADVDALLGGE